MSSAETMIEVPTELLPAGTEQRLLGDVTRFGDIETSAPRTGDIELSLTPDQTAAKLAAQEANEQLLRAATESVQSAYEAADAAKHEQMR